MVKSGMTQGKSEIVSGTNFGSKNEKLEPFYDSFDKKIKKMRYFG